MSLFFQRIVFFSQLSPFTVALMGCCVFCVGQGKGQASLSPFETQISSAFARARREGKPLWIMVSSPFCTPCRLLERLVLPHPSFQAALVRDFIPLKVYANGDSTSTLGGDALADRYAAYGMPSILFVEPSGELFFRVDVAPVSVFFGDTLDAVKACLQQIEEAKIARREFPPLRKRFQAGERSVEFLRGYLRRAVELKQQREVKPVLEAYLRATGSIYAAWAASHGYHLVLADLSALSDSFRAYAIEIADSLRSYLSPSDYEALYGSVIRIDFARRTRRVRDWWERMDSLEAYTRRMEGRFPFAEKVLLEGTWSIGLTHAEMTHRRRSIALGARYVALCLPSAEADSLERTLAALQISRAASFLLREWDGPDLLWVAVSWLRCALSLSSTAVPVWEALAEAYISLGRKKEAVVAVDSALDLLSSGLGRGIEEEEDTARYREDLLELKEKILSLPDR